MHFSGGENVQIGVCDDQKEMRELIVDNIKNFYRTEDMSLRYVDAGIKC